uniref:imm11 family protein n=1 Tax=uncultured Erythrobacter sp. TaxID=263913 RepID=UPI00260215ED|nr:DUF1629 domain-containing protein [uncultured Erythrobacter sp.]
MDLPKGLGEYFPAGRLEGDGWGGRLMNHFHKQPLEVQKTLFDSPLEPMEAIGYYSTFVRHKFSNEWGVQRSALPCYPPLTPILDHEPPTWFDAEKTCKSLASHITLNGMTAVDDEFRDLVERFEPGVHKFYPIEIRMPNAKVYPNQYYILVVGQWFDSLVPEKCKDEPFSEMELSSGMLHISAGPKNRIPDLAFAESVFGGAHLWWERRFGTPLTCLSDDLVAEIQKAGLRTPKMFKMIAA